MLRTVTLGSQHVESEGQAAYGNLEKKMWFVLKYFVIITSEYVYLILLDSLNICRLNIAVVINLLVIFLSKL